MHNRQILLAYRIRNYGASPFHYTDSFLQDVYFHTNSLATLVNMSSSILDIHPYVAQRLVR